MTPTDVASRAADVAERLFERALDVGRGRTSVTPGLDMLAEAGLYGLVAADASASAVTTFADHPVAADRLVTRQTVAQWQERDAAGLRTNGSLPLGIAARCAGLAELPWVGNKVDRARQRIAREAMFLQVFGSRPEIQRAHLDLLARGPR